LYEAHLLCASAEASYDRPVLRDGLGVLIGGSQYLRASTGKTVFALDLLDLEKLVVHAVALDFLAHGFTAAPDRHATAAVFQKRGPNAAIVELIDGTARHFVAGPNRAFYGHGAYDPDGRSLYSVEIDVTTSEGMLTVRDAQTLEVTGEIPTGGMNPHDALLLEGTRTLVVTNGGGPHGGDAPGSVVFIDLGTRTILDRVVVDDPMINAGHVAVGKDGSIALVSAPRDGLPGASSLGGLSLRGAGPGVLARVHEPHETTRCMLGESLSVAIHDATGVVAATHPFGSLLTFWHLEERRMLRSFPLASARGVTLTLDRRYFVVSHGLGGSLSMVDPHTLELVEGETIEIGRFTGSHVYAWRMPAGTAFPVT